MDYLNEAKRTYAITTNTEQAWTTFSVDSLNAALIALVETMREIVAEQRQTNGYLERIVMSAEFQAADGTLADFTQHPRPDWPVHCGVEGE